MSSYKEFIPKHRVLMGPGPSNVNQRVYEALAKPIIGHLDPQFLEIMDDIQNLLRFVFQTENPFTIAISGTGSSGMEACLINVLEKNDKVVIGRNGVFGERLSDVAQRNGCEVISIYEDWGKAIDPNKVRETLKDNPDAKAFVVVHAETSTGVWQPMDDIAQICKENNTLLIMDAVTSLGGLAVEIDKWGVDVCYSGTQKCLSCPPGLSPITFSPKALDILNNRKTKVQSWYLDMSMISNYWSDKSRAYHHTAPINMNYALRECLRIIHEEGLQNRFKRHMDNHKLLLSGLLDLGFEPFVEEGLRLPMLNSVKIPSNVKDAEIRTKLLNEYNLEIGGGLGNLKGKVWRIGLMGDSCQKIYVNYLLSALKEVL